jgi:nucleotide-binding universal stress UspA family protein
MTIALTSEQRATMITLQRVLVPHDFSETSVEALKYGIALARNFGAELYLLHVSRNVMNEFDVEFPVGLEENLEGDIREHLIHAARELNESLQPQTAVRSGAPATEIVEYAADENIDLIVMGTHGRGFVGHIVMGSVAEKVVRTAPCPVLTVRKPTHGFLSPDVARPTNASAEDRASGR